MDAFVKELVQDFNTKITKTENKTEKEIYDHLNTLLMLKGNTDLEKIWLIDDENYTFSLTEEGAQKIWMALGVFVEVI